MKNELKRRVWVEIDLAALVRNYRRIAARVAPAGVLCVLKANAYGLGVGAYARALAAAGCTRFGVAEPFEALELLRALRQDKQDSSGWAGFGNPVDPKKESCQSCLKESSVQILSSILPDEIPEMVRAGVILPVIDLATARLISAAAVKQRRTARVHFKLDTGMGRLGIVEADALDTLRAVRALPGLDCEGVFSHCPMAYDPHDPFTQKQIRA